MSPVEVAGARREVAEPGGGGEPGEVARPPQLARLSLDLPTSSWPSGPWRASPARDLKRWLESAPRWMLCVGERAIPRNSEPAYDAPRKIAAGCSMLGRHSSVPSS